MIINYTDIAAESESVTVSLEGLDAGTSAFMTWFEEQAAIETSFNDFNDKTKIQFSFIKTTDAEKEYSEFDFSSADIINPYEQYEELLDSLVIFPSYNKAPHTLVNLANMNDSEVTSTYVSSLEPHSKIYPNLCIIRSLPKGEGKGAYTNRYNMYKNTLGAEKLNDPRYGVSLIRIAKLNIDPANAIDELNNISF